MAVSLSIIIPTKDRARTVLALLASMLELAGLDRIRPQIIVGDNNSADETWESLRTVAKNFPVPITLLEVQRPGKSAVMNDAVRLANGTIFAFLDDDVIPDRRWLEAIEAFVSNTTYEVGQGRIELESPEAEDSEVQALMQRFRTISTVQFPSGMERLHSLTGANFAISRAALEKVGLFDERLGPGASGTSEDVELARRLCRAGIGIGYMPAAIVYHRVDRSRLTEDYFKRLHKKQGKSRLVFKNRSIVHILFEICRRSVQYGVALVLAQERRQYRSKGRVYHYLGMLEAKLNRQPNHAGHCSATAFDDKNWRDQNRS